MITLQNIQLILWDLDGTLIDSENLHFDAAMQAFKELSIPLVTTTLGAGVDNRRGFEILTGLKLNNAQNLAIYQKWEQLTLSLTIDGINESMAIPQSIELVKYFHKHNIQQAIVSNSNKVVIEKAVKTLSIAQYIDRLFSIEDVINPKPHPEPYQNAIKYYNVNPQNIIVFEDSLTGINSANDAGVKFMFGIGEKLLEQNNLQKTLSTDEQSWLQNFTQ